MTDTELLDIPIVKEIIENAATLHVVVTTQGRELKLLEQQLRDAAGHVDRLHRDVIDLRLELSNLSARFEQRAGVVSCPKCGSRYIGKETRAGFRMCTKGCGGKAF